MEKHFPLIRVRVRWTASLAVYYNTKNGYCDFTYEMQKIRDENFDMHRLSVDISILVSK